MLNKQTPTMKNLTEYKDQIMCYTLEEQREISEILKHDKLTLALQILNLNRVAKDSHLK